MGTSRRNPIPERHRTALVVAPQHAGCDEIVAALRKEGFRVHVAHDIYEAIAQFTDEPSKLVVLSLEELTRKDRGALRIFRRRAPEMRALLLLPEGRRGDLRAYLRSGADAIVSAPAYASEIRLLVRSLLRGDGADPLTGLPNREAYERAFEREKSRAERDQQSLGLAIIDLDGFRRVNDDFGYEGANRVLQEAADRLKASFRTTDVVARWGGDEFVALITRLPQAIAEARKTACEVLERARENMGKDVMPVKPLRGRRRRVTLKAGAAFYKEEGETRELLFEIANARLRKAKKQGGDRAVCGPEPENSGPSPEG